MEPDRNSGRLEIIRCADAGNTNAMAEEIRQGLASAQKYIPSKYFYDGRGSLLFERICTLPEYYVTRTELALLTSVSGDIMRRQKAGYLVELGSGSNRKIRTLLDAANGGRSRIRYVPIDVCEQALRHAAEDLLRRYPELHVSAMIADFHGDMSLLAGMAPKLIVFFGSTIGNLSPEESSRVLRSLAAVMQNGDRLIIGMDMVKEKNVLEAAYNDSEGVTAEFNRNMLLVLNHALGARFEPARFDHLAFYNEADGQIEMHLRATQPMIVPIPQLQWEVRLNRGETIRTEICRKFRRETVEELARDAGLRITAWSTDQPGWFSLVEMIAA